MNSKISFSNLAVIILWISSTTCSLQDRPLSVEERQLVEECYYDNRWKFDLKHRCHLITNDSLTTDSFSVSNMRHLYSEYVDTEKYDKFVVKYCFDHQDQEPDILIDVNGNVVHMPCEGITSSIIQEWTSRRETNKRNYFLQLTNEEVLKSYRMIRKRLEASSGEQTTTMDPDQLAIQ